MKKLHWADLLLTITAADPDEVINNLVSCGVTARKIDKISELVIQFHIVARDLSKVKQLCGLSGATVEIRWSNGFLYFLKNIFARPLLVVAMALWFFLLLYLPSKILFVTVEGNRQIPARLIIEKAENCGVVFGASRQNIRSEKVKNALLAEIPQLQWVGVNTYGCLAVISVEERSETAPKLPTLEVGNIVAARDGVVSAVTVTKGTGLCVVGQAVTEGQLLVSGYTDSGILVRAETASAEIMAITQRFVKLKQLQTCLKRNEIISRHTDYSIQIGKNVVKLSNSAGFSPGSCAKIYERYWLILPGGFQLPLSLIREVSVVYDQMVSPAPIDEMEAQQLLDRYIGQQMLSGRILASYYQQDQYRMQGTYICEEMIGKLRKEEIGK